MKRIWLFIFSLLIFLLSSNTSFAKSNYELPYPGLLPDSPLYFLRVIRDRTVELLIADPLKKAEYNLLQADKRLNAGIYLFNKGKASLSLSTISKAENYFDKAIEKIKEAKKQGMDVDDMQRRLTNAVIKHQEELTKLIKIADKNFKGNFEKESKRIFGFEQRLKH